MLVESDFELLYDTFKCGSQYEKYLKTENGFWIISSSQTQN